MKFSLKLAPNSRFRIFKRMAQGLYKAPDYKFPLRARLYQGLGIASGVAVGAVLKTLFFFSAAASIGWAILPAALTVLVSGRIHSAQINMMSSIARDEVVHRNQIGELNRQIPKLQGELEAAQRELRELQGTQQEEENVVVSPLKEVLNSLSDEDRTRIEGMIHSGNSETIVTLYNLAANHPQLNDALLELSGRNKEG